MLWIQLASPVTSYSHHSGRTHPVISVSPRIADLQQCDQAPSRSQQKLTTAIERTVTTLSSVSPRVKNPTKQCEGTKPITYKPFTTAGNAPVPSVSPRSPSTVFESTGRSQLQSPQRGTHLHPVSAPGHAQQCEGAGQSQLQTPQRGTHLHPVSAPGHPQQCEGTSRSQPQSPQRGTHLHPVSAPGHPQQCEGTSRSQPHITTAGNAPVPSVSPRSPSTVLRALVGSQQKSPQRGTHLHPVSAPGHSQQCEGAGQS